MLFDLSTRFGQLPEHWDIKNPSHALDFSYKAHLKRAFGALRSREDKNLIKSAASLGVSLRPYEPGDPLRALSKSHFVKTEDLYTRTDYSQGRMHVAMVFHGYENMTFKGINVAANKGQVALALAALIQAAHVSLGHSWSWYFVSQADLTPTFQMLQKKQHSYQYLYVISDLLFNESSAEASADFIFAELQKLQRQKTRVFAVRDPFESPDNNPLSNRGAVLFPFSSVINSNHDMFFSGQEYVANLKNAAEKFNQKMSNTPWNNHWVTGNTPIENIVNLIFSRGKYL